MLEQEDIDPQKAMVEAQRQKLELEIKKLEFDVESLGSTSFQLERMMRFIPLVTVIIAVGGFWFTVRQYNTQQAAAARQQQQAADKVIVEDTDVEGAMIKFHSCLTGQDPCDQAELQRRSQALASRARYSIGKSFNIKLGELKGKY